MLNKWLIAFFVSVLFSLTSAADESLIFYHDFNNGSTPKIAADKENIAYGNKDAIQYIDGIEGKAILLGGSGKDRTWLGFPREGNFNTEEGTIAMWVKPNGWNGTQNGFYFFFQLATPGNTGFVLYKYWEPPATIKFLVGRRTSASPNTEYATPLPSNYINEWKDGEWRHIAATWKKGGGPIIGKEGHIKMYIDGIPGPEVILQDGFYPEAFPGEFYIGSHNDWGGNTVPGPTAFDEFKIYSRELTPGEIKAEYLKYHRIETGKSIFSASYLKNAPVIDGKVNNEEWSMACNYGGFIDSQGYLSTDFLQPVIKVGYDEKNLYIAIKEPKQAYKLRSEAATRDGMVYSDDSYEIFLCAKEGAIEYCQVIINPTGAIYDGKGMDNAWNGIFKSAGWVDATGAWNMEFAIPFEEFNLPKPVAGNAIAFSICRNIINNGHFLASLSGGGFHNTSGFLPLKFLPENESITTLGEGNYSAGDVRTTFSAPPGMGLNTTLSQDAATLKELKDIFKQGQPLEFKYKLEKVEQPTMNVLKASITKGTDVLYHQEIPFLVVPLLNVNYEMAPDDPNMIFNLFVDERLKDRLQNSSVSFIFNDETGKKLLELAKPYQPKIPLNLAQLPAGKCKLEVALKNSSGSIIENTKLAFFSPNIDTWKNFSEGLDPNSVPAPWTPISFKDQTLTCWNRSYSFNNMVLPSSIISSNVEILKSPITLNAQISGKNCLIGSAPLKVTSSAKGKISLAGEGSFNGGKFASQVNFEFDGYSVFKLPLKRNPGIEIQKLYLDIPLRKDVALFQFIPFLNEEGVKKNDVGAVEPYRALKFGPGLWLGNDDVGLTWFTESDEYWYLKDKAKAIEIISNQDDCVLLRINFIDNPTEDLPETLVYAFGIQATPLKPFPAPKNWLMFSSVQSVNNKFSSTVGETTLILITRDFRILPIRIAKKKNL